LPVELQVKAEYVAAALEAQATPQVGTLAVQRKAKMKQEVGERGWCPCGKAVSDCGVCVDDMLNQLFPRVHKPLSRRGGTGLVRSLSIVMREMLLAGIGYVVSCLEKRMGAGDRRALCEFVERYMAYATYVHAVNSLCVQHPVLAENLDPLYRQQRVRGFAVRGIHKAIAVLSHCAAIVDLWFGVDGVSFAKGERSDASANDMHDLYALLEMTEQYYLSLFPTWEQLLSFYEFEEDGTPVSDWTRALKSVVKQGEVVVHPAFPAFVRRVYVRPAPQLRRGYVGMMNEFVESGGRKAMTTYTRGTLARKGGSDGSRKGGAKSDEYVLPSDAEKEEESDGEDGGEDEGRNKRARGVVAAQFKAVSTAAASLSEKNAAATHAKALQREKQAKAEIVKLRAQLAATEARARTAEEGSAGAASYAVQLGKKLAGKTNGVIPIADEAMDVKTLVCNGFAHVATVMHTMSETMQLQHSELRTENAMLAMMTQQPVVQAQMKTMLGRNAAMSGAQYHRLHLDRIASLEALQSLQTGAPMIAAAPCRMALDGGAATAMSMLPTNGVGGRLLEGKEPLITPEQQAVIEHDLVNWKDPMEVCC
jgi:hypothetical protein